MCVHCCHLAQIYWQITPGLSSLSCIFSVYFALIWWLWRWECDLKMLRAGQPAESLGSATVTYFYTLLSGPHLTQTWGGKAGQYLVIFIICWGEERRGEIQWHPGWTGDSNRSRADTLHQTGGWGHSPPHQREGERGRDCATRWEIFANCPASSARRVSTLIVSPDIVILSYTGRHTALSEAHRRRQS